MLQNVLIVANGQPITTARPTVLIKALFPALGAAAMDPQTMVNLQQWLRMLENLSSDQSVELRIASEMQIAVQPGGEHYSAHVDEESMLTCFLKVETLRKSNAGQVQVFQVAKINPLNAAVTVNEPNQLVVIKTFEMYKAAGIQENPLSELGIHAKVSEGKGSGVVPLLGCLATQSKLYAIFPYVPDGDMFKYLSELPQRPSERHIRQLMRGMLTGISRCHTNFICHRDISLENFLRCDDELKLIDFGLSVGMNPSDYSVRNNGPVGKTKYMAPELALGRPSLVDGRKLDIWSLGVTLFMLITQTEPFHIATNVDERYKTLITRKGMRLVFNTWGMIVSSPLMDLLESMLNPNADERPTADDIFNHPWMVEA